MCERLGAGEFSFERQGRRWVWSPEASALHGLAFERGELSVDAWAALLAPAQREAALQLLEHALCGTELSAWRGELGSSGRVLEWLCEPSSNGLRGVVRDVTAVTLAEQRLAATRRQVGRYQTMFMLSASLQALIDEEGRFALVTPQWNVALGWGAEEMVGHRLTAFLDPGDAARVDRLLAEGVGEGALQVTVCFAARGDRRRWLALTLTAAADQEGVLYAVAQDVTEERSAREEALAASRAKSRFLAVMSHEVRTPLNGLLGMTKLVLETALTAEQRENLEAAHDSAQNLLSIVNDVLDISKIEAGKLTVETIAFELKVVRRAALRGHAERASAAGLGLELVVEPGVPEHVEGDPLRVGQVLSNLVGNAVKFTPRGQVTVTVRCGEGGLLVFSVRDSGVGVQPERREAIFEAFTQSDGSTTRRYGGTGLGLTISRELVTLMGGTLSMRPAQPHGSVFEFEARLPPAARSAAPTCAPSAVALGPGVTATVLVAEDNPINARLTSQLLRKLGLEVRLVVDGQAALEAFCAGGIEAILMDVQMPRLDGLEATRRIRALEHPGGRRIPIIALTANAMSEDEAACREAGMDEFVTKPLDAHRLTHVLRKLLGRGDRAA